MTQPSTANVSGRGRQAGHRRAPSPEAGEQAVAGGARLGGSPARLPARTAPRARLGSARARPGPPHVRAGNGPLVPLCAALAAGRPAARGRSPGSDASASRSSRAAAAADAGNPWRGRAPAASAPRPARLRAPLDPPPAALFGIARAGGGVSAPGPAARWLRPGGRSNSHPRLLPARTAPA